MTSQTRPYIGLTPHDTPTKDAIPDDVFGYGKSKRWWTPDRDEGDISLPDLSFSGVIDRLPKAMEVPVYWQHPLTGEQMATERFNAIVDPEVTERARFGTRDHALHAFNQQDETSDLATFLGVADQAGPDADVDDILAMAGPYGDDALHNVPTSKYTIINPPEFLRPLAQAIGDAGLSEDVFGEFRVFGTGGKVSADVFFRGFNVQYADASEDLPIVLGLQIDWDHDGGTRVKARGMGMDHNCSNAIRGITDPVDVKHTGDVESRVDWREKWDAMLETLELKADTLAQMIQEAQARNLDLTDLPDAFAEDYDSILEAFYVYSGLPGYLARHAARNARAEAENPFEPSWWTLHSGATYAITHHSRSDVAQGSNIEEQNRIANDMLFNPGHAYQRVIDGFERAQKDDAGDGQVEGIAEVKSLGQPLMEMKEQFNQREEAIRRLQEGAEA